jgi:hypothetical protein
MQPQQPQQPADPYTPNETRNIERYADNHPLSVMAEGEQVIFDIHRHPIGLLFTYATFVFILLLLGGVAVAAPSLLSDFDSNTVSLISLSVLAFVTLFLVLVAMITHKIYYGNRWVLTDDSITQYTQTGLFNTQSSQLGMDSLEDVTVTKKGVLPYMFNYGVLTAQTAGENSKFSFTYCANPEKRAQQILAVHEKFEEREQWRRDMPSPVQRESV